MSGHIGSVVVPASGVGAQAVVAHLPVGVAGAARATLPFTGIALATYLGFALALLVAGFVLRMIGGSRKRMFATPRANAGVNQLDEDTFLARPWEGRAW